MQQPCHRRRRLLRGSGGETDDAGQVLGSGTAPVLLATATQQRHHIDPAGHDESANPWWAADFMCRQCDEIGTDRTDF